MMHFLLLYVTEQTKALNGIENYCYCYYYCYSFHCNYYNYYNYNYYSFH